MKLAYCTYFDANYLARGLAMIRSFRQHEPAAEMHALAFDETCARVLEDVLGTTITIVRAEALHAYDPELVARRGTRSPWAFYATHKPAFARFILESTDPPDALAYLDADLWFFDGFSDVFVEIGPASIGLSPHRFHEGTRHLAVYGTYNAGFIYWRNDATGRRSVEEWRTECLEWCEEKTQPDGRFMNQGYLNRWPERYTGVHVIRNPGVNLAPWNIDSHRVERRGLRVTVDGVPLVFYHFSGIVRSGEGWHTQYSHDATRFEAVHEAIYAPYLAALEAESRMLYGKHRITGTSSVRPSAARPSAIRLRTWPVPFAREPIRLLGDSPASIPCFIEPDGTRPDRADGLFDLGLEQTGKLARGQIEADGDRFFADLLPAELARGARVLEVGGGSGRLARYLAGRAAFIDSVHPSDVARVAARTAAGCTNVRVVLADIGDLPYAPASFDIVVSVGVLNAVPDTGAAVARLAGLLRQGGLLCLYLSYPLDGRPWFYRVAFQAAQRIRAVTSRLPDTRRRAACDVIAAVVYLPLIGLAALLRRLAPGGRLHESIPLHHCAGQPWKAIRVDALRRFGKSPERRFSKVEITGMLERAGFRDITFATALPRWRVIARKPD